MEWSSHSAELCELERQSCVFPCKCPQCGAQITTSVNVCQFDFNFSRRFVNKPRVDVNKKTMIQKLKKKNPQNWGGDWGRFQLKYYLKMKRERLGRAHFELKEQPVLEKEKVQSILGMIEVGENQPGPLEPTPLFYREVPRGKWLASGLRPQEQWFVNWCATRIFKTHSTWLFSQQCWPLFP